MRNFVVLAALLGTGACAQHVPSGEARVVLKTLGDAGGAEIGSISFRDGPFGLLIEPRLRGLTPGPHALHMHENGSCGDSTDASGQPVAGGGAGGHYDPEKTGRHAGPYGDGHLGDLPNLFVESDGRASIPVLAPRLQAAMLHGHALVIHAGADGYGAQAAPEHPHGDAHAAPAHQHGDPHAGHGTGHGTGGARAHCGVIE